MRQAKSVYTRDARSSNPGRRTHRGSNAGALLARETQFADARLFDLALRPESAHNPGPRMCLVIRSQVKMADFVSHRRAQNLVSFDVPVLHQLLNDRINDVDALNPAPRAQDAPSVSRATRTEP